MAEHNTLGKSGEEAAARYLERNGYVILHRNWRRGRLELDIVAAQGNELMIVEVKTRSNTLYAQPEEAITTQKIRHIVRAADTYLKVYGLDNPVRFDIITVVGKEECEFELVHLRSAFYPPLF